MRATCGIHGGRAPDRPVDRRRLGSPEVSPMEPEASVAPVSLRGTEVLELGYNLDHADALAAFKKAYCRRSGDPAAYRLAAATAWIDKSRSVRAPSLSTTTSDRRGPTFRVKPRLPNSTPPFTEPFAGALF